jgi:hypothetical protein
VKATVEKPVRSRSVNQTDIIQAANREWIPLMLQLRAASNLYFVGEFFTTTAGTGAWTTVYSSEDLASGFMWDVEALILAKSGTTAQSAWTIRGLFSNNGTVAQQGATTSVYTNTVAVFAVRFTVTANHITVDVQDDGALDVDWVCVIQTKECPL